MTRGEDGAEKERQMHWWRRRRAGKLAGPVRALERRAAGDVGLVLADGSIHRLAVDDPRRTSFLLLADAIAHGSGRP